MNSDKLLFAIYSCRKYLVRAEFLYRLIEKSLGNSVVVCIFLGKDDLGPIVSSCNTHTLNCLDGYDNLSIKTLTLLEESLSYAGIIKCDDDIFPNINYFQKFIARVFKNPDIHYAGRCLDVEEYISHYHNGKGSNNELITIPKCSYCAGPIYYLSNAGMKAIVSSWHNNTIVLNYNEDVTIGHNMGLLGFELTHNPLYCDIPQMHDVLNIQNIRSNIPFVFARIHGGLGNQLFQCASACGIAKMCGRLPVLVFTETPNHYQHNKILREYIDTVFRGFCCISYEHANNMIGNSAHWSEVDHNTPPDACFTYQKSVIDKLSMTNQSVFMNGYFQNENYFTDIKQKLVSHFYDPQIVSRITQKYPRTVDSYFIHVRRGDYVGNKLYNINYNAYLEKALRHLYKNHGDSIHFFVVTNDVSYCKSHHVFKKDPAKFTILNDASLSTLDTLHFMAACKLGGICANSSFSWWGSYLNPNPDKCVYFPYEWMTNIQGPIDVYPNNAFVIRLSK